MKRNIFSVSIIILMTSTFSLRAQWTQLTSGTGNNLYDVHFPSADTGYAVGYNGTILKTVNAGSNWDSLNSHTTATINAVYFTDNETGLAVGENGIILKTTDGGNNWILDSINSGFNLNDIYFTNSSIGFIAGSEITDPVMLKTTNAGASWNRADILDSLSSHFQLSSVHFPTADTGYAAFRSGVIKSTDAGNSWSLQAHYSGGADSIFPFSILESCYFTDANTGYIGGWYNPALRKTIDGADTWTDLASQVGSFQLHSIYFPGKDTGYAVGWYGEVYSTTNAGNNWVMQNIGPGAFYSVYFTDLLTGYAVGDNGSIIKTSNGGDLSSTSFPVSNDPLLEVFPNPSNGSIQIEIAEGVETREIFLSDLNGRNLKSFTKDGRLLDLRDLPSGIYLLRIPTSEGNLIRKIILE